ncbi:rhomboid family intramembrane serine protease [Paracoccus siganidrum]|uniref:Rhomboid family intramembrane serine protease n=1 Tax=Paracoccus siganidrum TaxID=1276757 RepID=A0A419A6B1_9RHOB|nr:rhomboid family intramembrane serine protease [Paracoccus siganidrum]RJL13369.1 rhomboid family intramembrane serine protease [Paracoccus siganidrum]RMC32181.1 rhomboid family intramembrane serine protease [Paracoccus siganidrum]
MNHRTHEAPINPLPPVVWLLALPIVASEAVFALGQLGLLGGADGIGLRLSGMQQSAFAPEMLQRMVLRGEVDARAALRLLTYPFVHMSLTHALFVLVFLLALGNMVARLFRPVALAVLFFGSAIGGALVYTALSAWLPGRAAPLIGGYPAVYGLIGAFTFVLWTRLEELHENRLRAFTLIGILMLFQLSFAILFGGMGYGWVAEIAGFVTGFGLSFVLVDGGVARVLRQIRRR